MITNEFQFKRAIFRGLNIIQKDVTPEYFASFLEHLKTEVGFIPSNQLDESRHFFLVATEFLMADLSAYYRIEKLADAPVSKSTVSNQFKLTMHPEHIEMTKFIEKVRNMKRFSGKYLRGHKPDLYRSLYNKSHFYSFSTATACAEEGAYLFQTNIFPITTPVALPYSQGYSTSMRSVDPSHLIVILNNTNTHTKNMESLLEVYQPLKTAFAEFERLLEDYLLEVTALVVLHNHREFLSRLLVPVKLIKDIEVREAFERADQEVAVILPGLEQVFPYGLSVHVYATDPNDDSTYFAKPLHASLPEEEATLLGVGQLTSYEPEHPLSLNQRVPYVVNGRIHVHLNVSDFTSLIPEVLLPYMHKTEELLAELGKDMTSLDFDKNHTYLTISKSLTVNKEETLEQATASYLECYSSLDLENEKILQLEELLRQKHNFTTCYVTISPSLLTQKTPTSMPTAIFVDHADTFLAIRQHPENGREVFTTKNFEDACHALNLPSGLQTVLHWSARLSNEKGSAMKTFYNYQT